MELARAGGTLANPAPVDEAGVGAKLGAPCNGVLLLVALGARDEGECIVLVFGPAGVGGTYPVSLIK